MLAWIGMDPQPNADIVRLEVTDYEAGEIIASRIIRRQDWKSANIAEYFSVPFYLSPARAGHQIELRVWWFGAGTVTEYLVGVS